MRLLSPLLVVSAVADTTLLAGLIKAFNAAGLPLTAADLGIFLGSVIVGIYTRWSSGRKLEAKVKAAVAAHVGSLVRDSARPARKTKKINV